MVLSVGLVNSQNWKYRWTIKLRYARLDPAQFTILTHLGHFADGDTGANCYPSLSRLAHDTHISLTSLKRHLNLLERAGWITRDRGTCDRNTRYTLHLDRIEAVSASRIEDEQGMDAPTMDLPSVQSDPTPRAKMDLPSVQIGPLPRTVPSSIDLAPYLAQEKEDKKTSPPAAHVPIHHERASAAHTSAHTHEGAGGREAHARVKGQGDLAAGGGLVFTPYEQEHRAHMEAPRMEDDEMTTKTLVGDWEAACVPLKDSVVDGKPGVQWIVGLWRRGLARYNRPMPSDMRLEAIGKLHMELAPDAPIGAHEGYVRRWCDDLAASSMSHGAVLSRILDDMRGSMHVAVSIFEDEREEVLEAEQERERAAREAMEREEQDRRVREAIIRRMEQEAAEQLAETVARRKAREAADEAALAKKRADDAAFEAFKARFEGRAVKGEGRP